MTTKRPSYCTCIHNTVLVCGLTLTDQSPHGAFQCQCKKNTVNKYNVLKKSQLAGVRPVGYSQSRAKELNSREPRTNPVSSTMKFGPFSLVNICSNKAFVSKCFFVIFSLLRMFGNLVAKVGPNYPFF